MLTISDKQEKHFNSISHVSISRSGVMTEVCPGPNWGISFQLDNNATFIMPFLNSIFPDAEMFESPARIQFIYKNILCNLYAQEMVAVPFSTQSQAAEFADYFVDYLNVVNSTKSSITPDYKTKQNLSAHHINDLLPQTNCKICGLQSCFAFACALSRQQTRQHQCPYFSQPITTKAVYPVYDDEGNLSSTMTLDIEPSSFISLSANKKQLSKSKLSARETEVLELLSHGATNKQISSQLFISPHTVKSHVIHIFEKLGVHDRTQAAVWAAKHNII